MHQLVFHQKPLEFKKDIDYSIKTLEDCIGKKVTSFRAPGFSITNKQKWAFEILYNLGIKIDCSIFPSNRAHGGMPGSNISSPCLISSKNFILKEFPINTYNFLNNPIIFSGGGYFRLFPFKLIHSLSVKSDYLMTYFHPRDFDPDQPILDGLNFFRIFKSYVGLNSTENKLDKLLKSFDFTDLKSSDEMIDWKNVKKVIL